MPNNAPDDWDMNFINMAISGDCDLDPAELLNAIKKIERKLGRIDRGFWGPREIDIDILIYGDKEIILENLIIPHKYLLERPFALIPSCDLLPNFKYPKKGSFYGKKLIEIKESAKFTANECILSNEYQITLS